jgi:hypothetical protein
VVVYGIGAAFVIGVGAALGPVAGVGAVLAVAAGLVVMHRPILGAYVLAAGAPALSGLHRGVPIPGLRLTEVMIVGIATLVLVTSIRVVLVTMFQQWNVGGTRELLASFAGPEAAAGYASTLDDVARASGPFPYWHNLAGYLMLVLLVVVSLLHEPQQRVLRKPWLFVVLGGAFVALIQTASLAPLLGLIVGSVFIAANVGQAKRLLAWIGIGAIVTTVAFAPVLTGRLEEQYSDSAATNSQTIVPQTIAFRWEVWTTQFVPVIKENIFLGYGPTLPPRLFFGYQESLYITFLLRGGVILLLVYLAVMGALAARARRLTSSDDTEQRVLARAVFAAVVLLLVIDTIATYFIDSGPAPLLWTLAGLMGYEASRARDRVPPTAPVLTPVLRS